MQCSRARVDGQRFATARRHANAALRAVERLIDWRKKIDGASAWHSRPTTTARHFLNQPKRAIARLLIKNIARRARRRTSCGANCRSQFLRQGRWPFSEADHAWRSSATARSRLLPVGLASITGRANELDPIRRGSSATPTRNFVARKNVILSAAADSATA